jgi:cysteine desulfurase
MIYLDWAASSVPDLYLLKKSVDIYSSYYANPSALHREGQNAQDFLNKCRKEIAEIIGCRDNEIIFTSGGTESNNIVINSVITKAGKKHKPHVIISGLEHDSVYNPAKALSELGIEVSIVNPEKSGLISAESIKNHIKENTVLVSLITVSNETGAIQPVKDISDTVMEYSKNKDRKILFHTDAVQAFGKVKFNPEELNIDAASISAHKIGGSRGIGILYIKSGCGLKPLYRGGNQEMGIRPGTENLHGIYNLSLVCRKNLSKLDNNFKKAEKLMDTIIKELSQINGTVFLPQSRLNEPEKFSPYILKVSFPPVPGEVLVRVLQDREICISTGSACSSRKKSRQRILISMGIPEKTAYSSVRISTGYETTEKDIDNFIKTLKEELPILQKASG